MKRKLNYFFKLFALILCGAASMAYADEAGHIVFVAGKAEIGGQQVALNAAVNEGAELSTGADGYLYLKTIDNGFFILRPNSRARIVSYHIDQKDPSNTHIKLELLNGVARSISGEAVKQARQNFRFNTPVAAIGVRGTDFTVFTTQETSRVAVSYGGVIVSGFGGACAPQGTGPCEGGASVELFARQRDQLVQISRGQNKPQLLQSNGAAPDAVAPPRPDEPNGKNGASSGTPAAVVTTVLAANDVNLDPQKAGNLAQAIGTPIVVVPPVVIPPVIPPITPPVTPVTPELANTIIWGRYTAVLGQPAQLDFATQYKSTDSKFIAYNAYFVLSQSRESEWQVPTSGSIGFGLKSSEAYIKNETSGAVSAATLENGKLFVDFGKASFTTSFDLISNTNNRYPLQANGTVGSDGRIYGNNPLTTPTTNMQVNGVITNEKGGSAAYLFQSNLNSNLTANGITYWGR